MQINMRSACLSAIRAPWPHKRWVTTQRVPLQSSVGRAGAKLRCPYPPGVPLLFPGELITAQAVEALQATRAAGGTVVDASDASLDTVLVARSETGSVTLI